MTMQNDTEIKAAITAFLKAKFGNNGQNASKPPLIFAADSAPFNFDIAIQQAENHTLGVGITNIKHPIETPPPHVMSLLEHLLRGLKGTRGVVQIGVDLAGLQGLSEAVAEKYLKDLVFLQTPKTTEWVWKRK